MFFSETNMIKLLINDPLMFSYYFGYWGSKVAFDKFTQKKNRPIHYAGRKINSNDTGNKILYDLISSDKPFMVGRYGTNESRLTAYGELYSKGLIKESSVEKYSNAFDHCGLYPVNGESMKDLSDYTIRATKQCDLYCVLYGIMENYYAKKYLPANADLTYREIMDFWKYEKPWTLALEGKRILVVHPFADLIKEQYSKREVLFKNQHVLPAFSLISYNAVQTINSTKSGVEAPFKCWKDALFHMYSDISKIDFDIALIACGAYGFPLAGLIKEIGKSAIHMGGVTQILFGIKGARWDVHPQASKLYNEYWVRPTELDKPKNAESVEGGCYW